MINLDTIGLLLLLGVSILGGGLYLISQKTKHAKKNLLSPQQSQEDTFETAEELFPIIQFPPETPKEHVPELPWGYSDNKITIMARDPEWIYAYWDISEERLNSLKHTYGADWDGSLPVLRCYDVTGIDQFDGKNANNHNDTFINESSGSWYLHVGVPNRVYCVDLGRLMNNGSFVVIARSNLTFTPRNSLSEKVDPEWMLVSESERKLFARMGQYEGVSSLEMFERQSNQD